MRRTPVVALLTDEQLAGVERLEATLLQDLNPNGFDIRGLVLARIIDIGLKTATVTEETTP